MNKILRLAFVAALAVTSSLTFAQKEVKFDFVPANSYEQFGLKGLSSTSSGDGDFTEAKTADKEGISITVSTATGKNPNRMWKSSLRMYNGTLTIKSEKEKIVKVVFVVNYTNWNATFDKGDLKDSKEGQYTTKTWEGSEQELILNVAKNTQMRSITVTTTTSDGIENIYSTSLLNDAPLFNLAGQRVTKDYKGVVIQNGKKFINR